jgi:hypothetical protein
MFERRRISRAHRLKRLANIVKTHARNRLAASAPEFKYQGAAGEHRVPLRPIEPPGNIQ